MAARTPTLRDLRGERTRTQIAESALRLFDDRGYDRTTVQDIATDALISTRTFYRYFATKDDPLFHRRLDLVDVFTTRLRGGMADEGPWGAVRDAVQSLGDAIEADSVRLLPRYRVIFGNPALLARECDETRRYVVGTAEALLETVDPSPLVERSAWLVAAAVGGVLQEGVRLWAQGGGRPDLPTVLDEGLRIVRRPLKRWPGS